MKENLESLLYSGDEASVQLALQIIEANPEWQEILEQVNQLKDWFLLVTEQQIKLREATQILNINSIYLDNDPSKIVSQHTYGAMKWYPNLRFRCYNRILTLDREQFQSLPTFVLRKANLQKVYLVLEGHADIDFFTKKLVNCSNIKELNISLNSLYHRKKGMKILNDIPEFLEQLTQIESLFLTYNLLSTFPNSVLKLNNLKHLHLGGNQICRIPKTIKNLQNLEVLSLSGNLIPEEEIEKLKLILPDCKIIF